MQDSAGEGAAQFHDYEGGGIGDGEGMKDVSDRIESEDQVCSHSLCKMALSGHHTCQEANSTILPSGPRGTGAWGGVAPRELRGSCVVMTSLGRIDLYSLTLNGDLLMISEDYSGEYDNWFCFV